MEILKNPHIPRPGQYVTNCRLEDFLPLIKEHKVQAHMRKGEILSIWYGGNKHRTSIRHWKTMLPGVPYPDNHNDAIDLLRDFQNAIRRLDGHEQKIRPFGGICRDIAKHIVAKHKIPQSYGANYRAIEQTRHQGRIEIFKWKGLGSLSNADIEKCYLNIALECPLPLGDPETRRIGGSFHDNYIELWICNVSKSSHSYLGAIPHRNKSCISWPGSGNWTATLWEPEIVEAIESGWTVTPLGRYRFRKSSALYPLFEEIAYLQSFYKHLKPALKRLCNQLLGTLATAPTQEKIVFGREHAVNGNRLICPFEDIYAKPYRQKQPPFSRPRISTYIWSVARRYLYHTLKKIPQETLVSCHTDGIIADKVNIKQFGAKWRIKESYQHGRYFAPWPGAIWIENQHSQAPGIGTFEPNEIGAFPRFQNRIAHKNGSTTAIMIGK